MEGFSEFKKLETLSGTIA